ncbi:Lipopolysaccharide heptosyltransferase I [Bathymodiolus heckerae thiotrophic gill symbiont]|nr:lipopolysaccharide heptosyltransferase I [Bathymodiolus heckerae thiotrophic gill symbiont]CAC9526431.1 Lipopolysaccharide core heptosyltransferase I [uncultured Gammaproteobacteria bacterium]CAC9963133.1 Lipopolysaccharide core heptosyltransferase I [uncultured Gammaproteobacteria bacterium]SHN91025.1 Lipopolysaccharide heptosyltransferase I [Bathymodiolus heckerae thiotrophic gill symbiont]
MKIAIVKLSALGDIIHAMVALQFIKKNFPNSTIDWIVEEGFKDILINNPDINSIHTVNIKEAKKNKSLKLLFKELRKLKKLPKYDVVIDTQGLIKSAIVAHLIPANKQFGFDKTSLREAFSANFYTDTCHIDYSENIIKRNAFVISSALGFNISHAEILDKKSFLHSNCKNITVFAKNHKPNIAFIPGASFKSKIYPVDKYIQLANELDANIIVLWGNEEEKLMADQIKFGSNNVSISEQLTLDELKPVIAKMDLVIGGDTGPTHMAWALNIPSITLFGSTPGYRNTYMTDVNQVIESNSQVNPYKIDKNDLSIKDIGVDKIALKAKELLKLV